MCDQGIGASHLRALAAMPQLRMLNLSNLKWTEDAVNLGPGWLVARLPSLRVFEAVSRLLVRLQCLPAHCFKSQDVLVFKA